jgi:tetratricopeptide (TPR) repeat protein
MPAEGAEPDYDKAGEQKMAADEAKGSGDFAKAVECYTGALNAAPSPLTHANRADCLLKCDPKRPIAAIRDCDKALAANPDSAKALKVGNGMLRVRVCCWLAL